MRSERRRLASAAGAALLLLLAAADGPRTFEVELWANEDGVERLPGVVSTGDHPCGATATVRLSRMPPHAEGGALGTELVAEAGPGGARWSVPVNYAPIAVAGSALLVELPDRRLWIETDGRLRAAPRRGRHPAPRARACPASAAHPGSDYAQCAEFRDLSTGRARLIEYEAPCT
ncbi:MAG TPA: hypothetical protein VF603_10105 [Allosphingosinicella sp.]